MAEQKEMRSARVLEVVRENERISTIYVDAGMAAKPGQFAMVWLPGAGEKPFSLSYSNGKKIGFSVAAIGPFSRTLRDLKTGMTVGIRGPLGNGFTLTGLGNGKTVAVVGGGCGAGPIIFLAEELRKRGVDVVFIEGAKTAGELFFVSRAGKAGARIIACTDDGSEGRRGFATDALAGLWGKEKLDFVFTCGPEVMMKKVAGLCAEKGVGCEASLERFMKCGFGVCGSCAIDGKLVCRDGPVFGVKTLMKLKELCSARRDACGAVEKTGGAK